MLFPEDTIYFWFFEHFTDTDLSLDKFADIIDNIGTALENTPNEESFEIGVETTIFGLSDLRKALRNIRPGDSNCAKNLVTTIKLIRKIDRRSAAEALWGGKNEIERLENLINGRPDFCKETRGRHLTNMFSGTYGKIAREDITWLIWKSKLNLSRAQELLAFYRQPFIYPRHNTHKALLCLLLAARQMGDFEKIALLENVISKEGDSFLL